MAGKMHGMLTFELLPERDQIEIHGDREGLLYLASVLTSLAEAAEPDHTHLFTEEWGGGGLTGDAQRSDGQLVHHVKVMSWPN